jgi:hypothetical protein
MRNPSSPNGSKKAYSLGRRRVHRNWNVLHRIRALLAGAKFPYERNDARRTDYLSRVGFLLSAVFLVPEEIKLIRSLARPGSG